MPDGLPVSGQCRCGRPLIERPGDLQPTCAECRNLADSCPCEPVGGPPSAGRVSELRARLLDSPALDSIPPPSPVIDGFLYRDSLAWLHGKPGNAKSFVALDWAGCVASGLPWQEHEVVQGPVLYLAAEGTSGLKQRVRAWEDYAKQTMGALFLPVSVQVLVPAEREALAEVAAEMRPALVVLDTQARVTAGFDENSAKDMGLYVAAVDRIRAASGACVLTVHHEARNGDNMRGSTALEGAATSIMRVVKDGSLVTLSTHKQKDAPPEDEVRMRLVPRLASAVLSSNEVIGRWGELIGSETKVRDTLLDVFVGRSATAADIADAAKMAKSTVHWALSSLLKKGIVANTGTKQRPRWELADTERPTCPTPSNPTAVQTSNVQPPFRGLDTLDVGQTDAPGKVVQFPVSPPDDVP